MYELMTLKSSGGRFRIGGNIMKRIFRQKRIRHKFAAFLLTMAVLVCQFAIGTQTVSAQSVNTLQTLPLSSYSVQGKQNSKTVVKKISLTARASVHTVKPVKVAAASTVKQLGRTKSANQPGYTYVSQRSGYEALSSNAERVLYNLIDNSAYQVANEKVSGYYPTGEIFMPYQLSEAKIREVIIAYTNDNPQVFWLANAFSYNSSGRGTFLQLYSYLPETDCNNAIDTFSSRVKSIVQSIPSGLSEFGREEYLFHYLVKTCSYDTAAATDTTRWQAFSAYGAFTDGKVVCEGYSRAMQLLCSYAGLPCALIRGTSDNVGHMWNAVQIDRKWYHLDLTWSDNTVPVYSYFNVTDQVIKQSRSIAPAISSLTDSQICSGSVQSNLFIPVCNSTNANYYLVKGIKVSSLTGSSANAVIQAMASAMANGNPSVAFYVDQKANYDTMVNNLFSSSSNMMKTYLQKASQISGTTIQSASYILDKTNRGFCVYLAYQ